MDASDCDRSSKFPVERACPLLGARRGVCRMRIHESGGEHDEDKSVDKAE